MRIERGYDLTFSNVPPGEPFEFDGKILIRLKTDLTFRVNAANLDTGAQYLIGADTPVRLFLIRPKLVLHAED